MTFSKSDFPYLKWSLLTLLLVVVAGGAAIIASENFVTQAQRDQHAMLRQLTEARSRLTTAQEDQANMQTYTQEYNSLLKRNVIGNDQRLDWIEGLEKIHKQSRVRSLMNFQYTIAPQQRYIPTPPLDSGNFELNLSGMTLQFELLHEEQLIDFFDTLRTGIKGWFILDHCALERSTTGPGDESSANADNSTAHAPAPRLKAECAGGWLTLKNRNAK